MTYNLKGDQGLVGDGGGGVEVGAVGEVGDADGAVGDAQAGEAVEAGHSDGLLEGDAVLLADAGDLDVGVAENGDAQRVVVQQPCVEGGQGRDAGDVDKLGDVDGLEGHVLGLGEVNGDKRRLARLVLEVHDALEGLDGGLGGARLEGGVDAECEGVGVGAGAGDALDLEHGAIDLALGNVLDTDKDGEHHCEHDGEDREDEVRPPKALQVGDELLLLGEAGIALDLLGMALVDLGRVLEVVVLHVVRHVGGCRMCGRKKTRERDEEGRRKKEDGRA